jgi:hypothetical protein
MVKDDQVTAAGIQRKPIAFWRVLSAAARLRAYPDNRKTSEVFKTTIAFANEPGGQHDWGLCMQGVGHVTQEFLWRQRLTTKKQHGHLAMLLVLHDASQCQTIVDENAAYRNFRLPLALEPIRKRGRDS